MRLANSLAERGASVALAYLNLPDTLYEEIRPGIDVLCLGRRGKLSWRALAKLTAAIRQQRSCVLVAVNLYPALYAALARLRLGRERFRLIVSINTTDVMTRSMARRMRLYRWALRRADTLVFGADTQRRLWREQYRLGVDGVALEVLYNGVDTQRFADHGQSMQPRTAAPRTRFVVGTVGRMRPEKAHIDLIRSIAMLRARGIDAGALIVGDGPERARIEAAIERLGLGEQIVLAGEARDVRPYLAQMDVFTLTSTGVETFSNAALEAMSAGLPLVTSRVGGMEELIAFGGGESYPPGDVHALTERLAGLLGDTARRQQLAAAARHAAVEHFGWQPMVDRFLLLVGAR